MHMLHRIHMSCYIEYTMHIHDAHATHHTHTHVCTITRATQHTHAHATHHTHTHAHATHHTHTHTHTHAKHHTPRKKKSRMTQSEGEWVSEWVRGGLVSAHTHRAKRNRTRVRVCISPQHARVSTQKHTITELTHQNKMFPHTKKKNAHSSTSMRFSWWWWWRWQHARAGTTNALTSTALIYAPAACTHQ